jgi:hypothetical protein
MQPRPGGVTVLAILNFVAAAALVCLGLAIILGAGLFGTMAGAHERGAMILFAGLGALGAVFFFLMAIVSAAIGYGMWNLQNWSRIVSIALCCLGILAGFLGMMTGVIRFHPFFMMGSIFRMAVAAIIIWYLFQPHVKRAFGTA